MERAAQKFTELRQEAEAQLDRKPLIFVQPHPGEEPLHELLHELRVHQIELTMQNEALRQAQVELEESRDRYVGLYDFAPVGYITLDHEGMITEINLTAAALLGVERNKLARRRFAACIAPADRDRWYLHFLSVLKNDDKRSCELLIQNGEGSGFYAMLYCQRLKSGGEKPVVRIVLTDLTEHKNAAAARPEAKP